MSFLQAALWSIEGLRRNNGEKVNVEYSAKPCKSVGMGRIISIACGEGGRVIDTRVNVEYSESPGKGAGMGKFSVVWREEVKDTTSSNIHFKAVPLQVTETAYESTT